MLTKSDAIIGKRVQWRPSDEHPCFGTIRAVKPDGEVIVEYDDGGMGSTISITLSPPSTLLDPERGPCNTTTSARASPPRSAINQQ